MIGCVFKESHLESNKCINFDEFLAEKIHSQVENFHMVKIFKYQTLLLHMVIHSNLARLQEQNPDIFSEHVIFPIHKQGHGKGLLVVLQLRFSKNIRRDESQITNKC